LASIAPKFLAQSDKSNTANDINPLSKELVIGLVGYAGSGCSTAAKRIIILLEQSDYTVFHIKISELIEAKSPENAPTVQSGGQEGPTKFDRATALQNYGDELRTRFGGGFAAASLAVAKVKSLRDADESGREKIAYIVDSIKHPDEVELLRQVYDQSFRLIAVHCARDKREQRLIGNATSGAKYFGVNRNDVLSFMDRDEKDSKNSDGQRVRDSFHLADFFLDNSLTSQNGVNMNDDIDRFINLVLDKGLVRPTTGEKAIYKAFAAAKQSACLSRQVGAVILSRSGQVIATGTNDPPAFKGGVYNEESIPDHRCFSWKWNEGIEGLEFSGCHNTRKKNELRNEIVDWLGTVLPEKIASDLYPKPQVGFDTAAEQRSNATSKIKSVIDGCESEIAGMPGIKDAIEYSRSIHAEMDALMSAARQGIRTSGTSLYVTTYPCHNCARHLIAAGITAVFYVEPYVKSLAMELHSDAINSNPPIIESGKIQGGKMTHMSVVPFTGVGPRMYEDHFTKKHELKDKFGRFVPAQGETPSFAVRLSALEDVEKRAVELTSEPEASAND
jgi:deoxycytidylate deaminase